MCELSIVLLLSFIFWLISYSSLQAFNVFFFSYDLSPVNDYLYAMGMGLHHSGVEILGREYSVSSFTHLCLNINDWQ
jgi:hypothetical protein